MKYVRIMLKGEPKLWFDQPIPEGTTFGNLVILTRANGCFMAPTFYIPLEQIHHMVEIEMNGPPPVPDVMKMN